MEREKTSIELNLVHYYSFGESIIKKRLKQAPVNATLKHSIFEYLEITFARLQPHLERLLKELISTSIANGLDTSNKQVRTIVRTSYEELVTIVKQKRLF